jgi:hypothetical protein
MTSISQKMLTRKMENQLANATHKLRGDLGRMKVQLERALDDLDKGGPLDESLIQNNMGITHAIVQYNTALDILPYLKDE